MDNRTGNIILIGMVLGAVIGALGGYFLPGIFVEFKFLGTLFLNALKMIVVPLIVASMIVGVASLGDIRKLGRTSGKTILYYFVTTSFAVIIGIILVNIIRPGIGIGGVGTEIPDMVREVGPTSPSDFIISLIPENIIAAAADNSVLPLIIFSLLFGGVLTAIGRKGRTVINFFDGLNTAIMKIVTIIIYFAPIGIIGIIGPIVADKKGSLVELASGLGLYGLTVIVGLLIHGVIVLPLILKFFGKKNPLRYFINMGQSLATAFTTASSSASLPITMECVTEKNKVNPKAGSFVLPLGATINMDGTALYEAVAAIFIAQAIDFPLSVTSQVVIFLTATLASIGAAAIPHAGLVTMVIVLSAVGLPLEGIGFIFAVDWFLDRCRTTVNVWGDSIGAAVIGETAEIKEGPRKPYQRKDRGDYRDRNKPRYDKRQNRSRQDRPDRRTDRRQSKDDRRKQPRQDKPDRRQPKTGYQGRQDRPDYKDRQDRPDYKDRQKRPETRPQQRPQPAPADKDKGKPEKNGIPLPQKTIEQELSKVRAQLNELEEKEDRKDSKPPVKPEPKKTDKPMPQKNGRTEPRGAEKDRPAKADRGNIRDEKKQDDEFFGVLPKFDFFEDEPKIDTKSESNVKYEPYPEEEPKKEGPAELEKPEKPERPAPVEPAERDKPELPKPDQGPDSDEDDEWGRGRKKRSR